MVQFTYNKGQYRLISEILLFLIGMLITSFVIINFNNVQASVEQITLRDQLESVSDYVATAIVKVSAADNATIRLSVPEKMSEKIYSISIKDADGGKLIINTIGGSLTLERQIFNIDYDNTNSNNHIINNSEVASSAGFIEIVKNEKITIVRVKS